MNSASNFRDTHPELYIVPAIGVNPDKTTLPGIPKAPPFTVEPPSERPPVGFIPSQNIDTTPTLDGKPLFVHENLFDGIKSQCIIFNGAIGLDQAYFDNVKATKAGKDIPWANAVTSFHVGGSSSSIFTADPVSFLTGGIGKSDEQFCITGTGVPDRLKAHTIGNFVTSHVELIAHETYTLPSKT